MMTFARVVLKPTASDRQTGSDTDTETGAGQANNTAEAWSQRLGVTVRPPCVVLLRGPGTPPHVSHMGCHIVTLS